MSRMRIVKIKGYFHIEHADGRMYWFKYEREADAQECLDNLSEAWNRNPLEEGKDLIVNFVKPTDVFLISGDTPRRGASGR
jgi:hypothetical protein